MVRSIPATRASAVASSGALSVIRTCTPSLFAYVATVGVVERTSSASASSTADSPMPSIFSVRERRTPPGASVGSI